MHDAFSKAENDFCPNPTKNHRFGQKTNEFCPNVYKNTWIWTKIRINGVDIFEIFLKEKGANHRSGGRGEI